MAQRLVHNGSGAIKTGGTSQQVLPQNLERKILIIQNPSTAAGQGIGATESLFVNFTNAAGVNNGTSIELVAGASLQIVNPAPSDAINVNAATTGHVFVAFDCV